MTESTPDSYQAAGELPPPLEFDPTRGGETPLRGAPGTVVLLLAGESERRWAAEAALELSGAWAEESRRIVLADLHLEDPLLHEVAGTDNLEGVVDVFLYGASVARSARAVPGRNFYLITGGTYEPDADAIYHHPRWAKLVAGFREASASLVLFAPAESADVEAIAEIVDQVVLLGDSALSSGALAPLASRGLEPLAVLVPPAAASERAAAEAPARSVAEERELMIPPPPVRTARPRSRGVLIALLVLTAAAVLGALGYFFALRGAESSTGAAESAPSREAAAGAAAPGAGASRTGDPLPYSVQVRAYPSLSAARAQLENERSRFPGAQFFISPEEIQGILYYRILAGLAPDTAAATRLREQLVSGGALEESEAAASWSLIQYTPLAFDLGEFDSAAEASAAADSLHAQEIPTYVVPVPYSDGARRWQLYGGAYRDSASAEALRERLREAGIQPRLVARIGEAAAPRR